MLTRSNLFFGQMILLAGKCWIANVRDRREENRNESHCMVAAVTETRVAISLCLCFMQGSRHDLIYYH